MDTNCFNVILDIFFSPSLEIEDKDGLYDTLREMMKDMFLQATFFPRIDVIVPIVSYEGTSLFIILVSIDKLCSFKYL